MWALPCRMSPERPLTSASRLLCCRWMAVILLTRGNAHGLRCKAHSECRVALRALPSGKILAASWKVQYLPLEQREAVLLPPGDICQCPETFLVVTTLVGGGHVSNWYLVDRGQGAAKQPTVHRQPHQTGLSGQVSIVPRLRNPAFDHYFCLFTYFFKIFGRAAQHAGS